jgi:transcriptional regulator with XRE-family HTH domain
MGHMQGNHGASLGELIAYERQRRGLTRPEMAELVRRADRALGTDESQIKRWEKGQEPQPAALRALAAVLGRPVEELTALVRQGSAPVPESGLRPLDLPPAEPADQDYVESIRATVQRLVSLESRCGSNELAPLSVRLLRTVRRRIDQGAYQPGIERDLWTTAGELAGLAGWQLYDADRREAARQMNYEALFLTRLAGDRSTELLTLANTGYMESRDGRPGCALQLARSVLAEELSNRLRVIFGIREGRALAKLGDRDSALRVLDQARANFFDGPGDGDPAWAWWIDEAQLLAHMGRAHADLGHLDQAMRFLTGAVELGRTPAVQFDYLTHLFEAATMAGAWSDSGSALERVLPYVGEIGSGRVSGVLHRTIRRAEAGQAPPRLVEAGRHLGEVLAAAGRE